MKAVEVELCLVLWSYCGDTGVAAKTVFLGVAYPRVKLPWWLL